MIARIGDAIDRSFGHEVLIVRGGTMDVHRLSGPVALVWTALADPGTRADICDRLAASAPGDVDVESIVDDCLDALRASDLIVGLDP